jgi:Spy/CpxP family protein refolding chaperone
MNKTSKLIALATLTVAVVLPASMAQDAQSDASKPKAPRGERGPGGGRPMAEMAEQLNLTADQKPKFAAAMRTRMEQMRALREASTTDEERRAKMQEITQNFRREVDTFLTAEQKAKLDEINDRMRSRWGGPDGGKGGGPGGGKGGGKGEGVPRGKK